MNNRKIDLLNYNNNFKKYKHVKSELIHGNNELIESPYITIAIPTYKRHILLKEAIDSALNQINTNCEYEVIVVDNEVKVENETEKLIKTYSNDRLLYYKNVENIGMYANWNRCIELSRGRWIAFLHDDDILSSDYISKIIHLINRKPNIGAIVANYGILGLDNRNQNKNIFSFKNDIKHYTQNLKKNKLIRLRAIDNLIWNTNIYYAPTCGTIFYKEYLIKEGGFNEEYFPSADWFFMFKFNYSYKVYKTFDILGYYRFSENESLNIDTIKRFIVDEANFREFSRRESTVGSIMYKIFKNEQHIISIDWPIKLDKSLSIKPEEFNYLCEYKIRPIRVFIYRKINALYWRIKNIYALIFG